MREHMALLLSTACGLVIMVTAFGPPSGVTTGLVIASGPPCGTDTGLVTAFGPPSGFDTGLVSAQPPGAWINC